MLSAVTTENADRRYPPSIYNCSTRNLLKLVPVFG
jgi:hypothetical protein